MQENVVVVSSSPQMTTVTGNVGRSLEPHAAVPGKQPTRLDSFVARLLSPLDGASLVTFRIGFGLLMVIWSIDYIATNRVRDLYTVPQFHFTYYGFGFVRPWSGNGMQTNFLVLCGLALCVALGILYRISTVLFAAAFTYFFLLDRTNYQNHYYLLLLLSWMLVWLPLNRMASWDAIAEWVRPSSTVPAWCLWIVRFHIALPYVFGGIAKLQSDWFAGEPMRTHLASKSWLPLIGPSLTSEFVVMSFVWSGVLFDLAVVPLLLWRPARTGAYLACVAFHLLNAVLFRIHVFPWAMIVFTTVFFEPDWPRRLCGLRRLTTPPQKCATGASHSLRVRVLGSLLIIYCGFHVAWPLRHHLYAGNAAWTERGHYFSWRMMLRGKTSALRYYVTDVETGETKIPNLRPYISLDQVAKFSRDPEMILQLAHFLAQEYHTQTGHQAEVHALVLTSMNGRKPQLLIDPNIDLANEPLGVHVRPWIMPLTEPLRAVAWSVPMVEWERYVDVPSLTFVRPNAGGVPKVSKGRSPHLTGAAKAEGPVKSGPIE
jgi:vitamin K-dependent gamma-carboxylase